MGKIMLIRTVKRSTGQVLTLLLLVLYIASSSNLEILHSIVHEHDIAIAHSEEQEKDPCHRLVYHNDKQAGHHHDSHLFVPDKCKLCAVAFHGDQTILPNLASIKVKFWSKHFDFYKRSLDSYWAIISSSRAPPFQG
jgi:hypothetical protein